MTIWGDKEVQIQLNSAINSALLYNNEFELIAEAGILWRGKQNSGEIKSLKGEEGPRQQ